MKTYLDWAAQKYYEGEPVMPDDHWDYLADVHNYNKVGAEVKGKIIKHLHQLYSLQKFYEDDKLPELLDLVKTPKLDGSAISLTYVHGELSTAVTRGDGKEGEDVTENFRAWYPVIPKEINRLEVIQIIGEIVAPKEVPNSRNYAAGAARLKDPKEFLTRDIDFVCYTVHLPKELKNTLYTQDLEQLKNWGFKTVKEDWLEDVYPTDGKVYRVNSNTDFVSLGYTSKHPRGAYALKNTSDVIAVHTELLDVIWQVGKSGKVTPVAIFEEIDIEGAKINRATLHNAGFIENLDLNLGDTIIVTRAGGIIPKVLGVA